MYFLFTSVLNIKILCPILAIFNLYGAVSLFSFALPNAYWWNFNFYLLFFLFLCFVIYLFQLKENLMYVFLKFYRALFSKLANIHLKFFNYLL